MSVRTAFSATLLCAISFCLPASAAAAGDELSSARSKIREVMTYNHIPSVTVAVARRGRIVWEEGFGFADVAKRIQATPHTTYSVASISKPVTATALMILAQRGVVDLDEPMDEYLGEQKLTVRLGRAADATVRRIADHTAGLPLHGHFFYEDEPRVRPSMDETIRRYGVLVSPPGESFRYSNLGYGLLEYAIERLSGKSYAQFVHDEIFTPLGLANSAVLQTSSADDRVAVRYWGDRPLPWYDFDHRGGSAVFMSAHDLVRFGMFHLHDRADVKAQAVLSQKAVSSMRNIGRLNDGQKIGYGIGWFVGEQHGLRWFGHNGGMAGVATSLSVYPDEQLVVVILTNGVPVAGVGRGLQIVQQLEDEIVHTLLPDTIRRDHRFKAPAELLGNWKGAIHTYSGTTPLQLSFRGNGSIWVRVGAAGWREVASVSFDPGTSTLSLADIPGEVGTPDTAHHPHKLELTLKLRGRDALSGAVSANSFELLPDRVGNALSYWVELRKNAGE